MLYIFKQWATKLKSMIILPQASANNVTSDAENESTTLVVVAKCVCTQVCSLNP